MSQRSRRQRRRGGARSKVAFVGGAVLALLVALAIGVTSWVLDVAEDAPSLSSCKPVEEGGNSVVYAGDGSKLGVVASDEARTPVALERVPEELRQATIAIEDERFYEHDGVDEEAIFRAAIKDLEAGEAVEGGSTITQQLVRNLCIPDPEDDLARKIVEAKLAQEYSKRHSRDEILGQYLNTASYGTINGSTAVGVQAASRFYFSKPVWKLNLTQAAMLAGPAAGADRLQPDPQPGRRPREAQRRAREDGRARLRQRGRGGGGGAARPGARRRRELLRAPPALLLRLRRGEADRGVRSEHGPPGGARRAHDDRPETAGGRTRGDGVRASLRRRPLLGLRLDRPTQRLDPGDGLQLQLRQQPVQPRRPGAAAARLDVQDLRADDGAEAGDRPLLDLLRLETARHRHRPLGPVAGAHRRRRLSRPGQPPAGDGRLRQHRLRPARPRRRPRRGGGNGEVDGDRQPARRDPGRGDRRTADRRIAAGDVERLRDPGRRGHPARPGRDPQRRLPRRPGREAGEAGAEAGGAGSRRLRGHPPAPRQHHRRHRHGRLHGLRGTGGKDRDHRRPDRRLVRRLPAQSLDRGLGRLPRVERNRNDQRPRHLRVRRHLPCRDLARGL